MSTLLYQIVVHDPSTPRLTHSFQINQIRQIATPLLNAPRARKGPYALRAEDYILAVLSVLTEMEHLSFAAEGDEEHGTMAVADEIKVRRGYWTELRALRAGWTEAEARLE